MFGSDFYHQTIRKYVTYFGTLFNDVYIQRTEGDVIQGMRVPLTYGPKDKVLERYNATPNLATDQNIAITLPRMAFEMLTMNYDGVRKLPTINRVSKSSSNGGSAYQYNPVPYNFTFTLYVMVKNPEDGAKILEQILPYFTPEWTATLELIPEMDVKMDIPISLMNVTVDDQYEGDFSQRRHITYTLDFMLKGYIFGPVKTGKVITLANTNFFDASSFADIDNAVSQLPSSSAFSQTPATYANGAPYTATGLCLQAGATPTLNTSSTSLSNILVTKSGRGYSTANVVIGAPTGGANYSQDLFDDGSWVLKLAATTEQFDSTMGSSNTGTLKFDYYSNGSFASNTTIVSTDTFRLYTVGTGGALGVEMLSLTSNSMANAIHNQTTLFQKGFNNIEASWDGDVFAVWTNNIPAGRVRQWYVDLSSNTQFSGQKFTTDGIVTFGDAGMGTQYYDDLKIYSDASIYNGSAANTLVYDNPIEKTTATATATVANGIVTAINITNNGSGYYATPTITISAPDNCSTAPAGTLTGNEVASNSNYGVITTWVK